MERMLQPLQPLIGVTGRVLLGLYFVIPGVRKILAFDGTGQYMATHGVPLISVLLPITIMLQVGGGAALIALADPGRRFDAGGHDLSDQRVYARLLERIRGSEPTARNTEFHQKSGDHGGIVNADRWPSGSIVIP